MPEDRIQIQTPKSRGLLYTDLNTKQSEHLNINNNIYLFIQDGYILSLFFQI